MPRGYYAWAPLGQKQKIERFNYPFETTPKTRFRTQIVGFVSLTLAEPNLDGLVARIIIKLHRLFVPGCSSIFHIFCLAYHAVYDSCKVSSTSSAFITIRAVQHCLFKINFLTADSLVNSEMTPARQSLFESPPSNRRASFADREMSSPPFATPSFAMGTRRWDFPP